MSSHDGFASEDAKDLHDIMLQCEQLRSTAKLGVGVLSGTVIKTLNEAAITIEKLALKSTATDSNKKGRDGQSQEERIC